MNFVLPVVVGGLIAGGLYMMMRRSMIKLAIGLSLLSHGANLLIFVAGGLQRDAAPLISETETVLLEPYADPLPQALILTAIVISFGLQTYIVSLIFRTYLETGTDDVDELNTNEE